MTEEKTESTGPKITRREFLEKAGEAVKAAADVAVSVSLANQLKPLPAKAQQTATTEEGLTEKEKRLIEEVQLYAEVEEYNDIILHPENHPKEAANLREVAEKRQIAFFNLITKEYLETAKLLLEKDESVQVREVLPECLKSSGITDPNELEFLVEEEINNWKGIFGLIFDRKTPSGRPELNFIPEDEQGQLLKGAGFRLSTPQIVEAFESNEIIIEGGFRVRQLVFANPDSIKPASSS